jgi:hypothetical protein
MKVMPDTRQEVVGRLLDFLTAARSQDGSWGYFAGKAGRLEPTSWAMLALLDNGLRMQEAGLTAAIAALSRWQQPSGLLADVPHGLPNLASNGLAALVLHRMRERYPTGTSGYEQLETNLVGGIGRIKGIRTGTFDAMRQDNRLQGWPWIDATFSWVEPTAWCLLALKRASRDRRVDRVDSRIIEANRLLFDRCCKPGGWNYGNSNVFGKDLRPYVPTTAVALMALQDQRTAPQVARSLEWMTGHMTEEVSGMALSLALLTGIVGGQATEPVEQLLCDHLMQTGLPANLATAAMAVFALTGSSHEAAAFTV